MKISLIQLDPTDNEKVNIAKATESIYRAATSGTDLVVLPELFMYRGNPKQYRKKALSHNDSILLYFANLAKVLKITLVLGTVLEKGPHSKVYDTTFVLGTDGSVCARYRKMHLFNVTLPHARIREADYFLCGQSIETFSIGKANVGLAICFDVRFPNVFTAARKRGANIFCIPSDFTFTTGKAHWHTLLKARAIETQSYICAANCCGTNRFSKVKSYGHSLIVNPWGEIIAELSDKEGILTSAINLNEVQTVRARMRMKP